VEHCKPCSFSCKIKPLILFKLIPSYFEKAGKKRKRERKRRKEKKRRKKEGKSHTFRGACLTLLLEPVLLESMTFYFYQMCRKGHRNMGRT